MREIDFLPDWYVKKVNRKRNYRRQYAIIAVIVFCLSICVFISGEMASRANADIQECESSIVDNDQIAVRYDQLKQRELLLAKQSDQLKKLDTGVAFNSIMSEISYLIDDEIVLKQLTIEPEVFVEIEKTKQNARFGRNSGDVKEGKPIRFKVSMNGIATDSSRVADLIKLIEKSPCFCDVVPGFTKNSEFDEKQVSEFELSFYIANYVVKMSGSGK